MKNSLLGSATNDYLEGDARADILEGLDGDDYLYGASHDDVLIGGRGNDYLDGGIGHDRYVFEKGHGRDVIFDEAGIDTIEMKDIDYANLKFTQVDYDLRMDGYSSTDDSITFRYFFLSSAYIPETFIFKNQTLNFAQMIENGINFTGTAENDYISVDWEVKGIVVGNAGNDNLTGGNLDDTLDGGFGNDTLYGKDGNDILIGGNGNDYLEGGLGNDRYLFEKGHGQDSLFDESGIDTIEMKDIDSANLTFSWINSDLRMTGYNGTDSIIFQGFNEWMGPMFRPETFVFKNQTLSLMQMMAKGMYFTGTSGDDSIAMVQGMKGIVVGGVGNDHLIGANLNDTLDGGLGSDVLYGDGGSEPTRVFRRQFILSHATLADSSNRR